MCVGRSGTVCVARGVGPGAGGATFKHVSPPPAQPQYLVVSSSVPFPAEVLSPNTSSTSGQVHASSSWTSSSATSTGRRPLSSCTAASTCSRAAMAERSAIAGLQATVEGDESTGRTPWGCSAPVRRLPQAQCWRLLRFGVDGCGSGRQEARDVWDVGYGRAKSAHGAGDVELIAGYAGLAWVQLARTAGRGRSLYRSVLPRHDSGRPP